MLTLPLSALELLLAHPRVDPSAKSSEALFNAYNSGHHAVLARLLKDPRVDPSVDDNFLLRSAALAGQDDLVPLLLSHTKVLSLSSCISIEFSQVRQSSLSVALASAAAKGHTSIVKAILACPEANPREQDHVAVRLALFHAHEQVAALLLTHPLNLVSRETALETNRRTKPSLQLDSSPIAPVDFPGQFTVRSGELLWGQLQCIVEGAAVSMDETQENALSGDFSGTILVHDYRFRVAAKLGTWKVARIYYQTDKTPEKRFNAFVAYHESADVRKLIVQSAKIGISNGQGHKNQDIVYINRYDWVSISSSSLSCSPLQSWHHGRDTKVVPAVNGLKEEKSEPNDQANAAREEKRSPYLSSLCGGRYAFANALPV